MTMVSVDSRQKFSRFKRRNFYFYFYFFFLFFFSQKDLFSVREIDSIVGGGYEMRGEKKNLKKNWEGY